MILLIFVDTVGKKFEEKYLAAVVHNSTKKASIPSSLHQRRGV